MLEIGNTFLILTPPRYDREHLFIIIAIQNNKALIVNITSCRQGSDNSCTLKIGDHPFITHPSVINYAEARITEIYDLEKSLKNNIIKSHDPISKEVLKKIIDGALVSPAIPIKFLDFLLPNILK